LKSLPAPALVLIGLANSLLGLVVDQVVDDRLMLYWILMIVNKRVAMILLVEIIFSL